MHRTLLAIFFVLVASTLALGLDEDPVSDLLTVDDPPQTASRPDGLSESASSKEEDRTEEPPHETLVDYLVLSPSPVVEVEQTEAPDPSLSICYVGLSNVQTPDSMYAFMAMLARGDNFRILVRVGPDKGFGKRMTPGVHGTLSVVENNDGGFDIVLLETHNAGTLFTLDGDCIVTTGKSQMHYLCFSAERGLYLESGSRAPEADRLRDVSKVIPGKLVAIVRLRGSGSRSAAAYRQEFHQIFLVKKSGLHFVTVVGEFMKTLKTGAKRSLKKLAKTLKLSSGEALEDLQSQTERTGFESTQVSERRTRRRGIALFSFYGIVLSIILAVAISAYYKAISPANILSSISDALRGILDLILGIINTLRKKFGL